MVVTSQSVIYLIMYLLVVGAIFWLLKYLIDTVSPPEPFKRALNIVLVVCAVLLLINLLLGFIGHPIFVFV